MTIKLKSNSHIGPVNIFLIFGSAVMIHMEQGKSEGFESCDRPIVRKRPIWVKIDEF